MAQFTNSLVHAADLNGNLPVLLASALLTGSASGIPLTVPTGYARLRVCWRARSSAASTGAQLYVQFNGDVANDYLWQVSQANNATVAGTSSGTAVAQIQVGTIPAASATGGYFGSGEFIVDGASDTTNGKSVTGTGSAFSSVTNSWCGTYSGFWSPSVAVVSMNLFSGAAANLAAGSSVSVWGLAA